MADKKDLSEAQSYSRRRLVTAFTSGIPDGVELMPKKNQTPVMVGGPYHHRHAHQHVLRHHQPFAAIRLGEQQIIVAKGSAARYVSSHGTLHPVINAISARRSPHPISKCSPLPMTSSRAFPSFHRHSRRTGLIAGP